MTWSDEVDPGGDAGRHSGHGGRRGGLAGKEMGATGLNVLPTHLLIVVFFLGK